MEVGYGILMEGRGIKTPRWERDLLILAGGMRDGFNFDSQMRDETNKNSPFRYYKENSATLTRRDWA